MGGEPTLHPDIEWMVDYLLERDLYITIFSNMATQQAVKLAEKFSILPIRWVANVNNPAKWSEGQRKNIEQALTLPQADMGEIQADPRHPRKKHLCKYFCRGTGWPQSTVDIDHFHPRQKTC